jgi:polyphenol oxidase
MHWENDSGLKWIQFDSINPRDVIHGIFSRHGGVSPSPWDTLNLGGTVGDEVENTRENKARLLSTLHLAYDSVFDVWQVHSADYIRTERPRANTEEHQKADIILTNTPGVTLMMRFADCVPLIAFDPIKRAIGLAHAGWIGTSKNVAGVLIHSMQKEFGSNPKDILAGIGPSICQDHYPVGKEVVEALAKNLESRISEVVKYQAEIPHVDLRKANEILLQKMGVVQIEKSDVCTVYNNQDWFSHRAEKGKTGRFGAIIHLKN